jgi:hypothetical protein
MVRRRLPHLAGRAPHFSPVLAAKTASCGSHRRAASSRAAARAPGAVTTDGARLVALTWASGHGPFGLFDRSHVAGCSFGPDLSPPLFTLFQFLELVIRLNILEIHLNF